jgi:hypothetical protein
MPNEKGPDSSGFKAAADQLREAAGDKNVALWPADSTRSSEEVSSIPQDKGLSFLAKRAYKGLEYSDDKAKDAAILLAALFVEKIGPDPKLGTNAVLRITPDHAELISTIGGVARNEIVYFSEAAETAAHAPVRVTLDTPTMPEAGGETGRTIVYDSTVDHGFHAFLTHLYKNAGYENGPAAEASSILYGQFMELTNGTMPLMKEGDRLTVSNDRAVFQPVNGPGLTLDLSDEARVVEHYRDAKAIVLDTSLMKQSHVFDATTQAVEKFTGSLTNKILGAIPDAIVYRQEDMVGGKAELCQVNVDKAYYTVIRNQAGEYRIFALSDAKSGPYSGKALTDWNSDFDAVKSVLA